LGETSGGVGKNGVLEHKSGNISEMRTDRGKVTMAAYRNSPMLFPTAPSPIPYGLSFPKTGVCTPPKTPITIISGTGKATNFKFGQNNNRVYQNKIPLKILEKRELGISKDCPIFSGTSYYLRNGKSYGYQIRKIHSEGPSKQKHIKNFTEK